MLSWRKARSPPTITPMNSPSIIRRCLSAKAISAFMSSLRRAGGAVDEQAALGDHALAGAQALDRLDHVAVGEAGLDLAQLDGAVVARDPDAHRAALVDQRLARHRDAGEVLGG